MLPLTKEETIAREPILKPYQDKLAGGFWTPADVTGDCHKFSRRIKALCERQLGVKFRFNSTVTELKVGMPARGRRVKVRGHLTRVPAPTPPDE